MKLRKTLCLLLAGIMAFSLMTGCIVDEDEGNTPVGANPGGNDEAPPIVEVDDSILDELGLEIIYDENGEIDFYRFKETKKISVLLFNRQQDDGRTHPQESYWTKWLQNAVLRDLNIEVSYFDTPRFPQEGEGQILGSLFASGVAPDIIYTYELPTINTYADDMQGILDLAPYVTGLAFLAPNLWELLGPELIYFNRNPRTGTIWAIEGIRMAEARINTFVREDWIDRLNIPEPRSFSEFEAMLYEFKSNANLLLGNNADEIIPFTISTDVGYRAEHLLHSFIPEDITDKVIYTHGFDSYAFTYPGIKDGVRVLNDWYNNGLVWQDFHLHGGRGDTREEDNMKNGFVGSMIHNWDWPYRFDSNGVQGMMRQILNDESVGYIAVNTFENDAGIFRKIIPANNDRKIAFPRSNPEPEASLLYLDYVSRLDVRSYLNAGELGINFEILPDGAVRGLDPTSERVRDNIFVADFTTPEGKTEWTWAELIMNSPRNIDYLMTFNTESNVFFESEEIFQRSRALSYPEAPPEAIERAARYTFYGGRVKLPIQAGTISAEAGMGSTLVDKRDQTLVNAVRTSPDNFDNIFDSGMADYLNSGGQAIIDERTRAWEDLYGDVENCTCNDNPETCGIHAT